MTRLLFVGVGMLCWAPHLNAQGCFKSSILSPSPFLGNNGEVFKLADGSFWEVKYEYEYLYEYLPSVTICPSLGKLIVGKKSLNVQLVAGGQKSVGLPKAKSPQRGAWVLFEETSLEGSISGTVQKGGVFKTSSGNIYEVTGLTLQLVLELQPDVTVLRDGDLYKLIVEGFEEPLICKLLNSPPSARNDLKVPVTSGVIDTRIDDEFEGWEGETVFKLSNGQIWQQASYAYRYHYAYRPKVLIYLSGSVYRMKVEGINDTIPVKRIK